MHHKLRFSSNWAPFFAFFPLARSLSLSIMDRFLGYAGRLFVRRRDKITDVKVASNLVLIRLGTER